MVTPAVKTTGVVHRRTILTTILAAISDVAISGVAILANLMVNHSGAHRNKVYRLKSIIENSEATVRYLRLKIRSRRPRKYWGQPDRTTAWWNNFAQGVVVDYDDWEENFRMSKESFTVLSDDLRPYLSKQITKLRVPISVEKQVAVFLYYVSDEGRWRKVAYAYFKSIRVAYCTKSR